MLNVSISSASMLLMSRGIPSTSTSGLVPPLKVLMPRIQNSASSRPGSALRWMLIRPASCPARLLVRLLDDDCIRSRDPTVAIELTIA